MSVYDSESTSSCRKKTDDVFQFTMKLLSHRSYSCYELNERLRKHGFSEAECENALKQFIEWKLLNDCEYAHGLLRHYQRKGFGAYRIKQELLKRGIARELIDDILNCCDDEQSDNAIRSFLENKLAGQETDKKQIDRCVSTLIRRGFTWEQIRPILSELTETFNSYNTVEE